MTPIQQSLIALADILRTHGRANDLNALAEDKKRLKHSEREAIEAVQDACMKAEKELRNYAARLTPGVSDAQVEKALKAVYGKIDMANAAGAVLHEGMRAALESVWPLCSDDAKDAARYRWLRDSSVNQYTFPIVVSQSLVDGRMYYMGPMLGNPLDAAIDAAMAAPPKDEV